MPFNIKNGSLSGLDAPQGYGGISVNAGASGQTISTTYVQITQFDTNDTSDAATTPDHTSDHITIVDAGDYMILGSFSFTGSNSAVYDVQAEKNNGATTISNVHMERKMGTGTDIGNGGFNGIHTFAANDTLEAWVKADGASKDFTLKDGTMSVIKLADA